MLLDTNFKPYCKCNHLVSIIIINMHTAGKGSSIVKIYSSDHVDYYIYMVTKSRTLQLDP